MQQLIKRFAWVGLLVLSLQGAWAFSLGGPIGNNPNPVTGAIIKGDAWQQAVIGYALGGDLNAPKNIGEEYRRNVPVMYYSCDANFLTFFGASGSAAVDATFAILNSLTNVDSYSPDLSEFSLETRHLNYQAQALGLVDLKSWMLGAMTEQLGLADPVRYDWTLHDRVHITPGPQCPLNMEYLVVQRNFDVITSPLNQLQYSPYINDTLYSYSILEFCTGPNPLATTFFPPFTPFPVDPLADLYSPVASFQSFGLTYGQFYTGLTRDDVAGLRYLLTASNFNTESAPAGSLLVVTNLSSPQLITTTNLGLFLQQAQTLDPNTLLAAYPGLIITATVTNFAFAVATNITAFYTNQPGPANTNFATLQLLTNNDLTLFSSLIQTDAPAVIQGLYPTLVILSSQIVGFTNIPTPILVTYLTNMIGAPAGSPPLVITYTNGFTYNIIPLYSYTFGNILTNVYSPNTRATNQTTTVTNWIGAPLGSPLITNVAIQRVTFTNVVSGDFFIIPTNWCGFTIQATQLVQVLPSFTNTLVAVSPTNALGSAQFTQNTIFYYTNRIYAVYPGVCEPVLAFATNVIGNIVTNYVESFANVVTNSYFTNSVFTFLTTNIFLPPLTPTNTLLVTNITTVTVVSNIPSGDFWIVPAAWNCGYTILSVPFTNTVGSTNTTLVAIIPPGVANIGQQYSVTTISSYTNHSLLIQPILCQLVAAGSGLREGIEKIQFVRANFDSLLGQFFQPITNTFTAVLVTNSQAVNQTFQRVVTTPDFIFSAGDYATGPQDPVPNPAVGSYSRNLTFDQTTALPGLAGPGLITPPTTISLNKVGPVYFNDTTFEILLDGTPYFNESPGTDAGDFFYAFYFVWASFDGSTNDPVVYPDGMSIQNLENEILVQISPTSLPNGTNGVAYSPITFTASGGSFSYSPPPTWAASGLPSAPASGLPPGLSLSPGGTLSGTPTQSGTFDFILKMTDSLSRSVQWNYSVHIQ